MGNCVVFYLPKTNDSKTVDIQYDQRPTNNLDSPQKLTNYIQKEERVKQTKAFLNSEKKIQKFRTLILQFCFRRSFCHLPFIDSHSALRNSYTSNYKSKENVGELQHKNTQTNGSDHIFSNNRPKLKECENDSSYSIEIPQDDIMRFHHKIHIATNRWYEGYWLNGNKEGVGTLCWVDASVYTGQFTADKAHGLGKLQHNDGDRYEGFWFEDKADGYGIYYNKKGAFYKGEWKLDKPSGFGIEGWPRGSTFLGEYVDGHKQGIGILTLENGTIFEGAFKNNDITGLGTFFFKDKRVCQGEFVNNKLNGFGVVRWPDGKYFEGHFVDDKKEGFGIYRALSKIYFGWWRDSKLEGEVIIIDKGVVRKFLWSEGKKVKNLDKDFFIPFEYLVAEIMSEEKSADSV